MAKLSDQKVRVAVNFLFPTLSTSTDAYKAIRKFIQDEFERLQTAVLYYRNKKFTELIHQFDLEIGTKEIIITPKSVRASEHYHMMPQVIYGQD